MAWNYQRALKRIREFGNEVRVDDVRIETFDEEYLRRDTAEREIFARAAGTPPSPVLSNLPRNRGVVTQGVHLYANLLNFDDFISGSDKQTEGVT
jgi:hypothetical protein